MEIYLNAYSSSITKEILKKVGKTLRSIDLKDTVINIITMLILDYNQTGNLYLVAF